MIKNTRILTALVLTLSCSTLSDTVLRDLPAGREHVIVIQRVTDPRLPDLADGQFRDVLDRMKLHIKDYLGYTVRFQVIEPEGILDFSSAMSFIYDQQVVKDLSASLLDRKSEKDRDRLRDYIHSLVMKTDEKILRAYVPGYERYKSRDALAEHIYSMYVKNLAIILEAKTGDGTALDSPPYARTLTYPFWDGVLRNLNGPHFIFTNTIMADMEIDIPIYVALRYGITTGMVETNAHNSYAAAGILFTYPFLADTAFFRKERMEVIPKDKLTEVIALYATHELGHFLNHYRDYYDHKNCIMVPANDLNYLRWYRERTEGRCTLAHDKLKNF